MVVKRYCKNCKNIFSLKNTTECIKIKYCEKCSDCAIEIDLFLLISAGSCKTEQAKTKKEDC